jgi:cellulose synthase/poly-beta-1,6-N-acetylglucosamine synthase-like glycosyltransferase
MMLVFADIVLLLVFGSFFLYLAILSVLALLYRPATDFHAIRQRRFAVVVPAHDEHPVIAKTLRSLFAVNYPRDLFDVVVVADNCSDDTADIARSSGATVYEREETALTGKGQALRWCFEILMNSGKGYDAFVVVDADSEVSGNMLRVMNRYLEDGARVLQISDVVKARPGLWNPEIIRLAFTLYNVVRPMGRKVIGCPAGLRGNGMCFAAETLRQVPWGAYSLTEDLEYGLMLLLHGTDVVLAPEATVSAAMPAAQKHSQSQRARWEMGRIPVIRKYAPLLLREGVRRRSFKILDALIDLVMPPVVNMLVVVLLMLAAHVAFELNREPTPVLWMWCAVAMLAEVHLLAGMIAAGADRDLYKAIVYVPLYAAWKMALYVKLLFRGKPREWIRTTREHQAGQMGVLGKRQT